MSKIFKVFAITITTLAAVLILAAVALFTLVNPNDYKERIGQMITQTTGRPVVFTGDLSLSFFPWLGVETGGLRIGNPEGFAGDFASVEKAGIHIKLMPLLHRDVQVSSIELEGLHLNLARNAAGTDNWTAPATAAAPGSNNSSGPGSQTTGEDSPFSLAALLVESIRIIDAAITFDDMHNGQRYRLDNLNLTTSAIRLGTPIDISLSTAVAATAPDLHADVDLQCRLEVAETLATANLSGVELTLEAKSPALPGGAVSLHHTGSYVYNLGGQSLTVQAFTASAYDAALTTNGTLSLAGGPSWNGPFTLRAIPRSTLAALGTTIRTADPDVLKTAAVSGKLAATPATLTITDLTGALDDIEFSGNARLKQLQRPQIEAALHIGSLQLDRYLPAGEEQGGATSGGTAKSGSTRPTGAVPPAIITPELKNTLRSLLLDADLTVQELTVSRIVVREIQAKATARDGRLHISPCNALMLEGRYDADITLDVSRDVTRSAMSLAVKNIQLAPLSLALTGERHISGTASFLTGLAASGDTVDDIRSTLDGDGSIAVTDGVIYGFQIIPEAAKAHLKGSRADKVDEAVRRQRFERLSATYKARKGRITNNDLALVSEHLNAAGAGYADLKQDIIDYKAVVRVTGLPDLPVFVSGSISKPRYGFDAGVFLKNTLRDVLPLPGLLDGLQQQDQSDASSKDGKKKRDPLQELGRGLRQLLQ